MDTMEMPKARRRDVILLCAIAIASLSCEAMAKKPQLTQPAPAPTDGKSDVGPAARWEKALATCVPGSAFEACINGLKGAGAKIEDKTLSKWRLASIDLAAPFEAILIGTTPEAAGRVVMVNVMAQLDTGKPRKQLLAWFKQQAGAAKTDRASSNGAGKWCGVDGFGVAWLGDKSDQPEVELVIRNLAASSPVETDAEHFKPEDALVKKGSDGVVDVCFLLPHPSVTSKDGDFVDAAALSARLLPAYLQSPHFHGKANLSQPASK